MKAATLPKNPKNPKNSVLRVSGIICPKILRESPCEPPNKVPIITPKSKN